MYKIAKDNLAALFQLIADKQELYLPVKNAGQTNYAAWTEEAEVDLDTLKTVKSAKDAFFPQSENLYTVKKENKKLKIEPEKLKEQNFVVFGMKACDVQGVEVLDKVFLADPVDSFYAARREHGTIVAMACHEPEETCFCKVFGIDAGSSGSGCCNVDDRRRPLLESLDRKRRKADRSCERTPCRGRGTAGRRGKRSNS